MSSRSVRPESSHRSQMAASAGVRSRRRPRQLLTSLAAAGALVVTLPGAAVANVSTVPEFTDQVTGIVYGVAQVGDRTFIGGDFTAVGGRPRTNVAALLPNGSVDPIFDAVPNGIVYSVAASANGSTVFLGGSFTSVDGVARANLVAVDITTGDVKTDWNVNTNDVVRTMTVFANRLYVGGSFTTIDGITRRRLAAVDTALGTVYTAFNPWPDWTVRDIEVSPDGSKIYAVGAFNAIGGQPRDKAAELLTSNGGATAFNPTQGGGTALAVGLTTDGSRMFYATENNSLFAYDPAVSNDPVWVNKTSGDTQAIAAAPSGEVYIGGHFGQVMVDRLKIKRNRVASVWAADGSVTAWDPGCSGSMGPWAILTTPTKVVVGGDFSSCGGKRRGGLVRFVGTP